MANAGPAERDGFTLIELMVVVLILGVLMGIAIPVLLSATGSARSTGAEANLVTAMTDEATFHLRYGTYGTLSTTPTIAQADGGLNWSMCASPSAACIADSGSQKDVYVLVGTSGGYDNVIIGAAGSSGSDYWEYESQNPTPTTSSPSYLVTASAVAPPVSSFVSGGSSSWKAAGG